MGRARDLKGMSMVEDEVVGLIVKRLSLVTDDLVRRCCVLLLLS